VSSTIDASLLLPEMRLIAAFFWRSDSSNLEISLFGEN
jgi:hypothetical protein